MTRSKSQVGVTTLCGRQKKRLSFAHSQLNSSSLSSDVLDRVSFKSGGIVPGMEGPLGDQTSGKVFLLDNPFLT